MESRIALHLAIWAQEGDPHRIDLHNRRNVVRCGTLRLEVLEQMQALVQGAQGEQVDLEAAQPFAYLTRAQRQVTQVLDLRVHLVTNALIRSQQPPEVDLYTPAALAAYPRVLPGRSRPTASPAAGEGETHFD